MDWWRIKVKGLSQPECEKIKEIAFTYPQAEATIGHGGNKSVVDNSIRKSTLRWLHREDPRLQWLYFRLEHIVAEFNSKYFGLDLSAQSGGFTEVQFTEYHGESNQRYDWHEDCNWKGTTPFDRKLSVVIQLSPSVDYEGGRLELHNDPLPDHLFRDQGDIIVFPSFNRHRVTPVTSGDRYSLVTWIHGPRLR